MAKITITINGSSVSGRDGITILKVAEENGIDIPTRCYRPALPPTVACRVCRDYSICIPFYPTGALSRPRKIATEAAGMVVK